jgi:hypothetical protein
LKKIGLLDLNESGLTGHARTLFQTLWADNGDAISRQYAGTDAMKVRHVSCRRRPSSREKQKQMEKLGIDPNTSRMQSERSTE